MPAWFGEGTLLAYYLEQQNFLSAVDEWVLAI
jgi:hypothetical protein